MADKANLRIADQPILSDDDPFAELTKIMGFDPRQPAKPAVAEAPVKPQDVTAAEAAPAKPVEAPVATKPVAEAKPVEVKPAEAAKPALVEAKPLAEVAPAKPADTAVAKPAEAPIAVKPAAEAKPAEAAKPALVEAKPLAEVAPAKPADTAVAKPAEAPIAVKPAAEAKPTEAAATAEMKPAAEAAPARPAPVKTQPAEAAVAKPAETLLAAKPVAEAKPVETKSAETVPARPAVVVEAKPVAPPVAVEAFGEVDLGIDLERELMGEFADDLPAPSATAVSAPPAPVEQRPTPTTAAVLATAVAVAAPEHIEASRPVEVKLPVEPAPVAQQPVAKPAAAQIEDLPLVEAEIAAALAADAAEPEQPAFDEFDAAAAAEMQRSLQQVVEADEDQPAEIAEPVVIAVRDQAEAADIVEAEEPAAPAVIAFQDVDLGDDRADAVDAPEPTGAVAELADTDFAHDRAASEWELDEVFDRVIAEQRDAGPSVADDAGVRDEAIVLPPALAVFRQMQSVTRKPEVAPVEAPRADVDEIALDASLEDELNALLGNIAPAKDAEPVAQADTRSAPRAVVQDDVEDDWEPVEPVATPGHSAAQFAPAAAGYTAGTRAIDLANQPRHNPPSNVAPAVEVADDDLDALFDDHAFDAAMTNAVAQADWNVEQTAHADVVANEPEESMPRDGHDPYAALAALSASLKAPEGEPQQPRFADGHAAGYRPAGGQRAAALPEAPEIETVDVPEQAVALADDLDLPELAFDNEPAPAQRYDDLDAEFTSLLDDMNASAHEPPARAASMDHREIRYDDAYFDRLAPAAAGAAAAATMAARPVHGDDYDPSYADAGRPAGRGASSEPALADMEFAYDPDFDEEIAGPAYAPIAARAKPRRGLLIASVVGGVALLGGVAAFALSFGDGNGSTELALVKADPSPVKVKPENPGGTVIPNQDSKVYDSVAGASAPTEPAQEKLLSSTEEPIEMPMPDDEPIEPSMSSADESANGDAAEASASTAAEASQPSGKAADRIEQLAAEPGVDESVEVAAVAPRKVRTMIVKADGTLVAREEPAPANPVESASEGIVEPVASTPVAGDAETTSTVPTKAAAETGTTKPAAAAAEQPPAEATPAPAEAAAAPQPRAGNGATPTRAPIAPARPSDQPVDIVGEVKPERVAALAPAAAAASGSWSMQIASQPTEAAAQSSYQDLLRRYGGVLGGHQATIVKAEIAGKGTFWRVRVPAGTRNDAIKLCESYKAAGGSCFVSK